MNYSKDKNGDLSFSLGIVPIFIIVILIFIGISKINGCKSEPKEEQQHEVKPQGLLKEERYYDLFACTTAGVLDTLSINNEKFIRVTVCKENTSTAYVLIRDSVLFDRESDFGKLIFAAALFQLDPVSVGDGDLLYFNDRTIRFKKVITY